MLVNIFKMLHNVLGSILVKQAVYIIVFSLVNLGWHLVSIRSAAGYLANILLTARSLLYSHGFLMTSRTFSSAQKLLVFHWTK